METRLGFWVRCVLSQLLHRGVYPTCKPSRRNFQHREISKFRVEGNGPRDRPVQKTVVPLDRHHSNRLEVFQLAFHLKNAPRNSDKVRTLWT